MSKPKSGLGRGLDSLISLSNNLPQAEQDNNLLTHIPIAQIRPSRYQARTQFDEDSLQELADSIKAQGIIQPITVREYGLYNYELIAGERRLRAAQLAGLTEVPVVIKHINDKTAMAMGLIENIQRENLNPIEEAQGLRRLIDEFELTHEAIAQAIGRSRSTITNSLRLLKLPDPIQDMMAQHHLEMGHARAIINLPVQQQLELAHKAVKNAWSVREMERRSQEILKDKPAPAQPHPDIQHIAEQLTENTVDDALHIALGDGDAVLLCRALNRVVAHDIGAEHVPADDGVNGVRDGITLNGDTVLADRRRARCTRNAAADGRVVHGNGVFLNDARSR